MGRRMFILIIILVSQAIHRKKSQSQALVFDNYLADEVKLNTFRAAEISVKKIDNFTKTKYFNRIASTVQRLIDNHRHGGPYCACAFIRHKYGDSRLASVSCTQQQQK